MKLEDCKSVADLLDRLEQLRRKRPNKDDSPVFMAWMTEHAPTEDAIQFALNHYGSVIYKRRVWMASNSTRLGKIIVLDIKDNPQELVWPPLEKEK